MTRQVEKNKATIRRIFSVFNVFNVFNEL